MKFDIIALAVIAAAGAAALVACNWQLATYAPGLTPARLFMEADIIAKLAMLTLLLLTFPVLILGVIGVLLRSAAIRMVLRVAALAAVLLGAGAAAYGWMNIQTAVSRIGRVGIEVTAPSYAEALLSLAWGLGVAAIALIFTVAAGLRARKPATHAAVAG